MFGFHKQPFLKDIFFGIIETSAPTLSWSAFTIPEKLGAFSIGWKERHYNIEKKKRPKTVERNWINILHLLPGCSGKAVIFLIHTCRISSVWIFPLSLWNFGEAGHFVMISFFRGRKATFRFPSFFSRPKKIIYQGRNLAYCAKCFAFFGEDSTRRKKTSLFCPVSKMSALFDFFLPPLLIHHPISRPRLIFKHRSQNIPIYRATNEKCFLTSQQHTRRKINSQTCRFHWENKAVLPQDWKMPLVVSIFALLFLLVFQESSGIKGGKIVTKNAQISFPHQVQMAIEEPDYPTVFCGGTLISEKLLTKKSYFCVSPLNASNFIRLEAGGSDFCFSLRP